MISFTIYLVFLGVIAYLSFAYKVGTVIKDVLKVSKHDENCFTQGLVIDEKNNLLYESCGLYGKSTVRKLDLNSFQIVKSRSIPGSIFAEGITLINNYVFMLTWKNKIVYIYDADSLKLVAKRGIMTKNSEGWGITTDGKQLIVSDGTDYLSFYEIPTITPPTNGPVKHEPINPAQEDQLVKVKELRVYDPINTRSISHINELEYVNGYVFANIWYQDIIIQINPENGHIVERYDLSKIFPREKRNAHADCLNGIAFNPKDKSFLVTGKLWSKYFHINFTKVFEDREFL